MSELVLKRPKFNFLISKSLPGHPRCRMTLSLLPSQPPVSACCSFLCLSSYYEPLRPKRSIAFLKDSNLPTLWLAHACPFPPEISSFTLVSSHPSRDPSPWDPCWSWPVWVRCYFPEAPWHPVNDCHDIILALITY